jgi:hypothetical protein
VIAIIGIALVALALFADVTFWQAFSLAALGVACIAFQEWMERPR